MQSDNLWHKCVGTTNKKYLRENKVKLNNIVRAFTWSKKISHFNVLHKKLEFLKL